MKALKSKLLVSITTLVVAIVSVAGSAYAWFTLSNTSTATMELTVTAGEGLQISTDGTNYSNSLDLEDLLYNATTGIFTDGKLNAVTSLDGATGFQKLAVNLTDPEAPVYSLSAATANIDYLSFPLYFRSPSNVGNLQLDLSNSTVVNQDLNPTVDATHSVRVSFTAATTVVWEPNTADDFGSIVNPLSPVPGGAWEYFTGTIDPDSDISALETYLGGTFPTTITAATGLTTLASASTWTADGNYYEGMITVRVWLEGFDEDNFDAIWQQLFDVNLVFVKG